MGVQTSIVEFSAEGGCENRRHVELTKVLAITFRSTHMGIPDQGTSQQIHYGYGYM